MNYGLRFINHTMHLHQKRYFDIDTMQFSLDKMEKIISYKLDDVIDDTIHNRPFWDNSYKRGGTWSPNKSQWFQPLDNDWED